MIYLGSWGSLNILAGSVGYFLSEGEAKYFHQMNALWNTVNVGIAGFALHQISKTEVDQWNYSQSLHHLHSLEKVLLFNAALDVGYMATGAWLWERGLRNDSARLTGYGKSLIVQGGFLFGFDLILYLLHRPLSNKLNKLANQLEITASGIRIHF